MGHELQVFCSTCGGSLSLLSCQSTTCSISVTVGVDYRAAEIMEVTRHTHSSKIPTCKASVICSTQSFLCHKLRGWRTIEINIQYLNLLYIWVSNLVSLDWSQRKWTIGPPSLFSNYRCHDTHPQNVLGHNISQLSSLESTHIITKCRSIAGGLDRRNGSEKWIRSTWQRARHLIFKTA
jgi:hypothetical protein